LTFIGNKQETRYCYDMRKRQERTYCYYIVSRWKTKPNIFSAYTREASLIVSRKPKISTTKMIPSFHPSCGRKNRNLIETQLPSGQPMESILQRDS
ncbi:hypothetical protein T12_7451, partial [Trichinella patagoniensis]